MEQAIKHIKEEMADLIREQIGGAEEVQRLADTELEELSPSEAFDYGSYRTFQVLLVDLTDKL